MKNFSDYEFKPSDVIDGLNRFYEFTENHRDYLYAAFTIHTTEPSKTVWSFSKSRVPDAITYLREECDIFYTPGMDWADLKYKLTSKACEKEYGTADIREMYPRYHVVEDLRKENDELRNQVQNLKDLINQIHEDSDI